MDLTIFDMENPFEEKESETFDISDFDMSPPEVVAAEQNYKVATELETDPDAAATDITISRKTGFPIQAVRLNREKTKRLADKPDFEHLMSISPGVNAFASTSENMDVAWDDIENLSLLERAAKNLLGAGEAAIRTGIKALPTTAEFLDRTIALTGGVIEAAGRATNAPNKFLYDFVFDEPAATPDGIANLGGMIKKWGKDNADYIRKEILSNPAINLPEELQGRLIDNPEYLLNPEWLVTQAGDAAISMVPVIGAYMTGGASAAMLTGGAMEGSASYTDMLDDPEVGPNAALSGAMTYGMISGVLNRLGLDRLMQGVPTTTVIRNITHRLTTGVIEGVTEYLEEPVQAGIESIARGDDPETITDKVIASLANIDVAVGGVLLGASSTVARTSADNKLLAQKYAEHLANVANAANNTKLKARSPEKLKEAITTMGVDVEVFVSAEDAAELFQIDEEGTKEFSRKAGIDIEAMQEAVRNGQAVKIQTGDILAHTDEAFQQEMLKRVKPTPGAMSLNEASKIDQNEVIEQIKAIEQEEDKSIKEVQRIEEEALNAGLSKKSVTASMDILGAISKNLVEEGIAKEDFLKKVKVFYQPIRAVGSETKKAKGSVLKAGDTYAVKIFANADQTTLVHEFSHIFLAEYKQLAKKGMLSENGKKNVAFLKEWMGVDSFDNLNVELEEKFAKSFEEYLSLGKAPSKTLRPAFRKFKAWMTDVYANNRPNIEEAGVKDFFDSLLIDKAQIETVTVDYGMTKKPEGFFNSLQVLPEDRTYLSVLLKEAKAVAEENMKYDRDKQKRSLRDTWKKEAEAVTKDMTVYQVTEDILKGEGLNREALVAKYGEGILEAMPHGSFKKGGRELSDVAISYKYEDVDDMITAVLEAPSRREFIQTYMKEQEANHDAQFDASDYLSYTDQYASYLEIVDSYVRKSGDTQSVATPTKAFSAYAKRRLQDMPVSQAARHTVFLTAMKNATVKVVRDVKKKDWASAFKESQKSRLNHEFAKEAVRLRKDLESLERRIKRTAKIKGGSIHPDMLDAIKIQGMRFGILKSATLNAPDEVKSLDSLLEVDTLTGDSIEFDDWITKNTNPRSIKNLTVSEFSELSNLFSYLIHRGREMSNENTRTLSYAPEMTFEEAKENITSTLRSLSSKKVVSEFAPFRKFTKLARSYGAGNRMFSFMMRAADGSISANQEMGWNEKLIVNPLAERHNLKLAMSMEDQVWHKEFVQYFKDRIQVKGKAQALDIDVPVPESMQEFGRTWTFERVLMIALNMGTEQNRRAIMEGYGLSEDNLATIFSVVDNKEDLKVIQSLWDNLGTRWGQLSASYEKKYGVKPSKVEATPFVTPSGLSLKGGYFPLRFDRALSANEPLDIMKSVSKAAFGPTPFSGMTKKRAATSGGKPPKLSLNVLAQHIEYVNSYIAYADIVKDVDDLINAPEYRKEFSRVFGSEFYGISSVTGENIHKTDLRSALKELVGSRVTEMNEVEKVFQSVIKGGTTRFFLGLNPSVMAKQVFSLPGFIQDNTFATYQNGLSKCLANPAQAYQDMLDLSPSMNKRAGNFDSSITESMTGQRSEWKKKRDTVNFALISAADALTVTPMWWGSYLKAMDENGGDVNKAVAIADNAVSFSQPFNRAFDKAPVQNEKGVLSFFNMFLSFALTFENRKWLYNEGKRHGTIPTSTYVKHVAVERILPPLAMNLFFSLLYMDFPDEPEDLLQLGEDVLLYQLIGLPVIREFASALNHIIAREGRTGEGIETPIGRVGSIFVNALGNLFDLTRDGTKQKKALRGVSEIVSFGVGLPVSRVYDKAEKSFENIAKGEGTPGDFMLIPNYK